MKVLFFFFLLNIIIVSSLDINKYYRKQFTNETGDPHLKLTNGTSPSEIPLITFTENIPRNATLLKIDKNQLLISCSQFPYDELLFQYINQYFTHKKMASSFYIELFNLIVKVLYYKYAPLKEIKKEFKSYNESITKDLEFKINDYLKKYIDVIYSQLNSSKYYNYFNKVNKDFVKKYKLQENYIANEVYDYIIEESKKNKNKKVLGFIKSFLYDKKDEFIKLFNYINANGFSAPFPQYEYFYAGRTNTTNFRNEKFICVYISPITDMLDTKVNLKNTVYSFSAYPIFNKSLLLYTRSPINVKDNKGLLTKYFTATIENFYFQYNYLFDEYKKFELNKYTYSKQIDIIIPKKILEGEDNKKISACQIMNLCKGLTTNDDSTYKMNYFISSTSENPHLMNFGRLLFIDEAMLNQDDKETFRLFIKTFSGGAKINDQNEYLAHLFYYQQLNREIGNYKDFFNDVKNKQKEIEENKDLFRIIELNLRVVLMNYIFVLDKMEKILNQQIINNI